MENNTETLKRRTPLQPEEAEKLRNSFRRLMELNQSKIITKDSDAEKRMLQDYISRAASQHFNELLGCWFALHMEYEPLIQGLMPVISRCVNGILGSMAQQQQQQQPQQQSQCGNTCDGCTCDSDKK